MIEPTKDAVIARQRQLAAAGIRLQDELTRFDIHDAGDIERVWKLLQLKSKTKHERITVVLQPVRDRYAAAEADAQAGYRNRLGEYLRFYSYLSQIMGFADLALEKLSLLPAGAAHPAHRAA